MRNVLGYQELRATEWSLRELVANHSLFGLVKLGAWIAHIPISQLTVPYYLCSAAVMGWAFFGRLWKMPVANQLLAVTVCMLSLPSISYYHTLVHLYAPMLVLACLAIRAQRGGTRIRGMQTTLLLCLPLFVPYTTLTFPHKFVFCGMLQSLFLGSLFLCALEFPFAEPGSLEGEGPAPSLQVSPLRLRLRSR